MFAMGDEFQRLLAEFPALTVPTFSATIAKHGVEHCISMVGLPFFAWECRPYTRCVLPFTSVRRKECACGTLLRTHKYACTHRHEQQKYGEQNTYMMKKESIKVVFALFSQTFRRSWQMAAHTEPGSAGGFFLLKGSFSSLLSLHACSV
ncbi:hypothetical protein ATANTOWER_027730 [Ataeniobius toweri]|uniref:Uncharacterized protein n=1 Tax=Ataeniobius toweri TaxID=208326 RepID=A0ABU7ARD0_9TELE|nr:hypothetical protein [Ataeniobius toweri]